MNGVIDRDKDRVGSPNSTHEDDKFEGELNRGALRDFMYDSAMQQTRRTNCSGHAGGADVRKQDISSIDGVDTVDTPHGR